LDAFAGVSRGVGGGLRQAGWHGNCGV
jgi:hypothetical protein